MITLVPVIAPIVDTGRLGSIVGGRRIVLGWGIVGSSLIAPIVIPIISGIGITVIGSSSRDGSEYSQPDANSDGGIAATSPTGISGRHDGRGRQDQRSRQN